MNSDIVRSYKSLFFSVIENPESWRYHDRESNFFCSYINRYVYTINSKNDVFFIIDEYNCVIVKHKHDVLIKFDKILHWKMYMKIIRFRKYLKNIDNINKLKKTEKLLVESLPNNYIRTAKLYRIKSKL